MGTRKHYRYTGIRPGKTSGIWYIGYTDWRGVRHQKSFTGSEANAAKLRRYILVEQDKIRNGLQTPPEAPKAVVTLYQLWEAFEADRRLKIDSGSMEEASLARCRNTYNALLEYDPALKSRRLDKIWSTDFEGFKIHRQERGFAAEGVNTNLRGLRTLFNFAVDQGFIDKSPLKGILLVKVPHSDVRYLNEDELRSLYFTLEHLDLSILFQRDGRDLVLFLLYTGSRVGEALFPTFTWANNGQDALHFHQTKTSSARSIPKGEQIKEILEGRKHEAGGPFRFDKYAVYKRVKWVFEQAGIENASPHTLRKTAGSLFYLATRDIFATSRFLGHSSVNVTEKHYAGLIQSLQVENYRAFEEVVNPDSLYIRYSTGNVEQSSVKPPDIAEPVFSSEKEDFSSRTPDAIRTRDLRLRRPLLYPAELPGLNTARNYISIPLTTQRNVRRWSALTQFYQGCFSFVCDFSRLKLF